MKKILLSAALLLFATQGTLGQTVNRRIVDADGAEQLLGRITTAGLSSMPFSTWYDTGVQEYAPDKHILDTLHTLRDFQIEVFMGTWCSDSRREVPRLMKILRDLEFPAAQLSIVGVNRTKEQYKRSPGGEELGKNIHRVPTIILYQGEREIGRIVESPVLSLEHDIRAITSGDAYSPNYQVVARLEDLFANQGVVRISQQAASIARELGSLATKPSELDTYGYVHLYQQNIDKAVAIFKVNQDIFPGEPMVHASLAMAYREYGDHTKAGEAARQALELDPNNQRAQEVLGAIVSK